MHGSATTMQILKCTHYKCSLRAHISCYMAPYELVIEQFFKDNPDLVEVQWQTRTPDLPLYIGQMPISCTC